MELDIAKPWQSPDHIPFECGITKTSTQAAKKSQHVLKHVKCLEYCTELYQKTVQYCSCHDSSVKNWKALEDTAARLTIPDQAQLLRNAQCIRIPIVIPGKEFQASLNLEW